jgi:hypothetical protein
MNNYQYLRFFNKRGEYCNFNYDESNDKWIGRIDMQTVSEGLFETEQIYILEEIFDTTQQQKTFAYPHSINLSLTSPKFKAYFDIVNPIPQIALFDVSATDLTIFYEQEFNIDVDSTQTVAGPTFAFPNIKESSVINHSSLQINVSFGPTGEDSYKSILYIENEDSQIIAEITFYGEGETEDERLRALLMSMGNDILPSDSIIFDASDVKEENPDWTLINRKRKELLLEYSNIFPYMGSYKALINILKYYGYQNVYMKEYWKNVDQTAPNFGKYRQTDIIDIFSTTPDPQISKLIPSKIYKKTNMFGLFYDINVVTDQFDTSGTPITQEVFTFTPEEVLIKLFALKRKLIQYYLPLNAKIVDIIGEAVFFATYKINSIVSQNRIDAISLGIKPSYEVYPSKSGYLKDLRPLLQFGAKIGPDMGPSSFTAYRVYQGLIDSDIYVGRGQKVQLDISFIQPSPLPSTTHATITYDWQLDETRTDWTIRQICDQIVSMINDPSGSYVFNPATGNSGYTYVYDRYTAYVESNNNTVRIVEKSSGLLVENINFVFTSTSTAPFAPTLIYPSNQTIYDIDPNPGGFWLDGAPLSFFTEAFVGYFNNFNVEVSNLNDAPDIPIGYPIVLKNKTFDITWDNANATYNQIDAVGTTFSTLYSQFTNSFTIAGGSAGWTTFSNPVQVPVASFPSNYPNQFTYTWENLGFYNHVEMQWIVWKDADETPAYRYDTGQRPIPEINELGLYLPYVGKYNVELRLWDLYNTQSFLIDEDIIEVKMAEGDFIGWYTKRELEYAINTPKYEVQRNYLVPNPPLGTPPELMTWDEYTSTWELPLHPNEAIEMAEITGNSLDSIEFYQTMINPIDNPLVDRYAYTFDLIDDIATWDDAYHLWWDNTGTRITEWAIESFNEPNGSTAGDGIIFMARANNAHLLTSYTPFYTLGPTGWTGATSTGVGFTGGDLMFVKSLQKVFIHDGTDFALTNYEMDALVINLPLGTAPNDTKLRALATFEALNTINEVDNPIFSDFIYYYNEKYDSNYSLVPYIKAASKVPDKTGRHRIGYSDEFTGDFKSYETVYFGYLGDIPTHFEIPYISGTSNSFTISYLTGNVTNNIASYTYTTGATTLHSLCNELNGPSAQALPVIGDFIYNMVYGSSGWSGGTGPTSMTDVKVQGVAKAFVEPQSIGATCSSGMKITSYGRSLIKNPTWDNLRIAKYADKFPLLTTMNFTYDNSKIVGKTQSEWFLEKEGDPAFSNIYYNNQYFSYMFNQKGSYSLSLTITDSNGNKNTIKKSEIIKIV